MRYIAPTFVLMHASPRMICAWKKYVAWFLTGSQLDLAARSFDHSPSRGEAKYRCMASIKAILHSLLSRAAGGSYALTRPIVRLPFIT